MEAQRLKDKEEELEKEVKLLKEQFAGQKLEISQLLGLIGKKDCFALDTKVQLASGKFIEMAELQVGDRVCSNVKNSEFEFSEVYLISHLGHYKFPLEMIKIEFTNPDGTKSNLLSDSTGLSLLRLITTFFNQAKSG